MPAPERTAIRVTDLRGSAAPVPEPILADPSGRRAVLLHRAGRAVGALFVLWFVCLVLAGLGLLPASGIPLAGSVAPRTQPQRLSRIPAPAPTPAADLRPAKPLSSAQRSPGGAASAQAGAPSTKSGGSQATKHTSAPVRKPGKPVPAVTTNPSSSATTVPAPAASAPGKSQSTTTPGKSTVAPGHAPAKPGNGNTATTTTTTPGRSGTAPGQTRTDTTGHGPPK